MRFLILNTDYPQFLQELYAKTPGLAEEPFARQMAARMETMFGVADFYSHALKNLGHQAIDVHANNGAAQQAWGREHGVTFAPSDATPRALFPWTCRMEPGKWQYEVLAAQLRHYRPDVVLNQAMDMIDPAALREFKPFIGQLVGQHASPPLKEDAVWSAYDLAVSSFMPRVEWFRQKGLHAELNRLAFDRRVIERVGVHNRDVPLSFVGTFLDMHTSRTALLERLAEAGVPLKIWGMVPANGLANSPLSDCYMGPAWGMQMYEILARSRIVINHHGNVPPYANNLRLFESTGSGAMLLTDDKPNLKELFKLGAEIVAYGNADECLDQVQYYLAHEEERSQIARAGQARTLAEHTFENRMAELIEIIAHAQIANS
ncbi:MAG: glycosyltransferase family 1 protein [Phycisphaerales bacterium]|nr:glycosyltransferase family 1 protein [Phycisphaerales bacterium]